VRGLSHGRQIEALTAQHLVARLTLFRRARDVPVFTSRHHVFPSARARDHLKLGTLDGGHHTARSQRGRLRWRRQVGRDGLSTVYRRLAGAIVERQRGQFRHYQWGLSTDIPEPGDYDGDGKTDIAVYRPSTGTHYILLSSTNFTTGAAHKWGISPDLPEPGDYDGDGKTDIAVFRHNGFTSASTLTHYILLSSTNFTTYNAYEWGLGGDIPEPGDYDGDGKTDIAVFRRSNGTHYILLSRTNFTTSGAHQWGGVGDSPEPGDYDGDGKTDIAAFRFRNGTHYILLSSTNFTTWGAHQWGVFGDVPEPGDYDGDGKTDIAVYRPSDGFHYILLSSTNFRDYRAHAWGESTDIPVLGSIESRIPRGPWDY
jgi:FG-GAP-like repeat